MAAEEPSGRPATRDGGAGPGAPDPAADRNGLPAAGPTLAQARSENFPVASRLVGPVARDRLLAIYGFARLVDDVGDEVAGDRRWLLDRIDAEIDLIYAGGEPQHPLLRRLAVVVRDCGLEAEPLHRLVEANRRDQEVSSYASFDDLLGYCALSANPVGVLVLGVFGAATPDRIRLADRICSGLQVTEHLQDVREDLERGRVYLPRDDLARFGCSERDLALRPAPERVRALVSFEVERARDLLRGGAPLVRRLRARPAVAVAAFAAGGQAALAAIERAGYDVSGGPPRTGSAARARGLARAVRTFATVR